MKKNRLILYIIFYLFYFMTIISCPSCKKKKKIEEIGKVNIPTKEMIKAVKILNKYIKKFYKFKVNKSADHLKNHPKRQKQIQNDFIETNKNKLLELKRSCLEYIKTKGKEQPKPTSMKKILRSIEKTRIYKYLGSEYKDNSLLDNSPLTASDMNEFESLGKEISNIIWGDYY